MKVPKRECRVNISCLGGTLICGTMHISEGLRALDSLNDARENFFAVTQAQVKHKNLSINGQSLEGFEGEKEIIMVSKSAIEWVEEIS